MTEVPTWVLWLVAVISPLLTFGVATAGVVLTRRGVNEAIAESRVARQQAGEIAERQAAQSRRDGLMEYGRMAVDLLLSDKPDLMKRGEAMIAYLSSLPPEILPAEDRDLLIAMMTVGGGEGRVFWRYQHGWTGHLSSIRQRSFSRHRRRGVMTKADTAANGRVTANQVRAARLVADLARTWGVAVPQTLQDIAETDLEPASTNGHVSGTKAPTKEDT